jgi:hypothetical protein
MVFNLSGELIFFILIGFLAWLTVISFLIFRLIRHYNHLTSDTGKGTLGQVLESFLAKLDLSQQEADKLAKRIEGIEKNNLTHIQKVGFLRFNPFAEVGGDQSFVLALLDAENDGIVLTSLTSRTGTRWYGKKIKKGAGVEHELSTEEREAIKKANN